MNFSLPWIIRSIIWVFKHFLLIKSLLLGVPESFFCLAAQCQVKYRIPAQTMGRSTILRLCKMYGVVTSLPRVVGPMDLRIVDIVRATILHRISELFPKPTAFDPSRWHQENCSGLESFSRSEELVLVSVWISSMYLLCSVSGAIYV